MRSCIYQGVVRHSRYFPVKNRFSYTLYLLYLDLAELDEVFAGRSLWSVGTPNLAWLKREDHFGDPRLSIEESVRQLVEKEVGTRPAGPIRMLAHLRYFGHCFNPATFYYCYDKGGTILETIIVEIHNTPWGDVFCYVLDLKKSRKDNEQNSFDLKKIFHVSPFIDMDIEYRWSFEEPGEKLKVYMEDHKDGAILFQADLELQREQITGAKLARMLCLHPPMTMKVVAAIYWQAFRLWSKGAPFYSHPTKRTEMEDS